MVSALDNEAFTWPEYSAMVNDSAKFEELLKLLSNRKEYRLMMIDNQVGGIELTVKEWVVKAIYHLGLGAVIDALNKEVSEFAIQFGTYAFLNGLDPVATVKALGELANACSITTYYNSGNWSDNRLFITNFLNVYSTYTSELLPSFELLASIVEKALPKAAMEFIHKSVVEQSPLKRNVVQRITSRWEIGTKSSSIEFEISDFQKKLDAETELTGDAAKSVRRDKQALKVLTETIGAKKIRFKFLDRDELMNSGLIDVVGRIRRKWFDQHAWKDTTPAELHNTYETDIADLLSTHVIVFVDEMPIGISRISIPEMLSNYEGINGWAAEQPFLVTNGLRYAYADQNSNERVDNLASYINSPYWQMLEDALLSGRVAEAQRFLTDFTPLEKKGLSAEQNNGDAAFVKIFLVRMLSAAVCTVFLHHNVKVVFDQADQNFTVLLEKILGEYDPSTGEGGLIRIGSSWTTNSDADSTRMKTNFNLILPKQGLQYAIAKGDLIASYAADAALSRLRDERFSKVNSLATIEIPSVRVNIEA